MPNFMPLQEELTTNYDYYIVQKRSSHPSHFVTKDKFRLVRWCNRGRKLPFHSKHFLKPFGNPKCMTNNEHFESFVTRLQFKVWLLGVKHKIERSKCHLWTHRWIQIVSFWRNCESLYEWSIQMRNNLV